MKQTILGQKAVLGWGLYDWANSAYVTTVVAGFFPIFFKEYWADPADPLHSTFYLGVSNSLASIVVAIFAPFLGALADRWSGRKRFLAGFAYLGVVSNLGLVFLHQGYWQLAIVFYVLASIGFSGGNIFYDALLNFVARPHQRDLVSAFGYALGYLGGGLVFLVNVLMYQYPHWFGIPDSVLAIKYSFASVSLWWAVFSLPLFFWVKEPPNTAVQEGVWRAFSAAWQELRQTLRSLRHYPSLVLFLTSYWLYIDGVDTIIRMAIDYGKSLGFANQVLITALLVVQFVSFPFALLYGWFGQWIGTRKALLVAIAGYLFISLFGYFMSTEWHFYVLAILVSVFMGGIQALSRSFYSRLIPREKSAEFFGFYNMLGKFAVFLGPLLLGVVARASGNIRYGVLSVSVLFLAGGALLLMVREPAAALEGTSTE